MDYTDFTMDMLLDQFQLQTDERDDYFAAAPSSVLSPHTRDYLTRCVPLAINIGTEKARSELIIAPIFIEVIAQYSGTVSFFSGVEFSPDPDRGLRGVCDFLLSLSPEQLTIKAPVVTVVEAKNDNIKSGFGPCMAEMLAAQVFNQAKQNAIETVFGVVTTGSIWRFLRLRANTVYVDRTEYHISQAEKIVGILLAMLREAASSLPSQFDNQS